MAERLRNQNLYVPSGTRFDIGVAHPNVADLVELDPKTEYKIKGKYGHRFGHIPRGGQVEAILIEDPKLTSDPEGQRVLTLGNRNTEKQARYIGELSGDSERFRLYTPSALSVEADNGNDILIAPYLNNGKFYEFRMKNGLERPEITVSGMQHDVVAALKDKAEFHNRVKEEQNPDFAVPHHEVVNVQEIGKAGKEIMDFQEELYSEIGMPNYQRGVFGRLNYSDGGYGSFNIKKNKKGEYVLETDDQKERDPYKSLENALEDAQDFMIKGSGNNLEAEVVLSRALDLKEVPGLSMHFMDGEALPLGFNGQILEPKTKACIGTTTYEPNDPEIIARRDEYEHRVAQAGKAFVHGIAEEKGLDVQELRGFINVDVMIIGDQEKEAQRRILEGMDRGTLSGNLVQKLEKYGQLRQPVDYFLAESNPRRTNLIEAIDEIVLIDNMPQTMDSMQNVIDHGIRTEDYHPLPTGVDVDDLSEALGEKYAKDKRDDGLVVLRMRPLEVPKPGEEASIGIIMTGDIDKRHAELHDVYRRVRKAA